MSLASKLLGVSVVIDCAAMRTRVSRPCWRANASEQTMAAAAPQVGGQHCRRVSGSNTVGEASTSSSVTVLRNTASGLRAACWRAFTEMRAKGARRVPQRRREAPPAPPQERGTRGAGAHHGIGLARPGLGERDHPDPDDMDVALHAGLLLHGLQDALREFRRQ